MASTAAPPAILTEVAALPVRLHALGLIEILLVQSDAGRWIVPMDIHRAGTNPADRAAALALIKAGVSGEAEGEAFGHFVYERRLIGGSTVPCSVALHVLYAAGAPDPPMTERARWFRSREAARQVCNIQLQRLIDRAGRSLEIRRRARSVRECDRSST